MDLDETIAAIASSHEGGGLRGIVRVSGPGTIECVSRLFHTEDPQCWIRKIPYRSPGFVELGPPLGQVETSLFLWPTHRSYTRQPMAELHTYGAKPLLDAMVDALSSCGARLARPGEFTMRAFLAGRIDLAQAEAVLGVIDAKSQRQLNVALTQLAGGLSQPLGKIRDTLLNLCADLEAGLDFVEEDIAFITAEQVIATLGDARRQIVAIGGQMAARESGSQLPTVVLRGEPNVGKSSLWNAMVGDPRAIVTPVAGTTRDYLQANIRTDEGHFQCIDTAGFEETEHPIARAANEQAKRVATNADLILLCIDSTRRLTPWEHQQLAAREQQRCLIVLTKADLPPAHDLPVEPDIVTSADVGRGIQSLIARCVGLLAHAGDELSVVGSTATRCRESLRLADEALLRAEELAACMAGDELVAAEVRSGLEQLGQVVGHVYTDDLLDRIFSRFCIGK